MMYSNHIGEKEWMVKSIPNRKNSTCRLPQPGKAVCLMNWKITVAGVWQAKGRILQRENVLFYYSPLYYSNSIPLISRPLSSASHSLFILAWLRFLAQWFNHVWFMPYSSHSPILDLLYWVPSLNFGSRREKCFFSPPLSQHMPVHILPVGFP